MEINSKIIETQEELLNIIKSGTNPFDYIKSEKDVDFVCRAITHNSASEDPYWDDSSETLLKALVYYLMVIDDEEKTLNRCKEIVESGIEERKNIKNLFEKLEYNHIGRMFYTSIDIAPDKTYKEILETLNKKISEIIK